MNIFINCFWQTKKRYFQRQTSFLFPNQGDKEFKITTMEARLKLKQNGSYFFLKYMCKFLHILKYLF